ncbi:adenylate kinase [filamentous cyanobacterium LEGE 11480]|uniref:Adenylate kinase n=1 Tax=Romeriopsis navalis LEGE 11480 TaxID=2777977 RepID=A0A928VTX7_9CYAN|nr:adenylate kinase [Romeriopsis navalis]MBE9032482.1 adenylate kinase [Romeriopsis navalis LEGE 11480]
MTRLIFLGAPGAGKGTQAIALAAERQIAHISTGDILRQAVVASSEIGLQAKAYVDNGELVPDSLVIALIRDRLTKPDAHNGWILDGFPRNLSQAEALNVLLQSIEQACSTVIYFEVPQTILIQRMLDRGREDDNQATVQRRLEVYQEQTVPLINFYQKRGYLQLVDGGADVVTVASNLREAIGPAPVKQ